MARIERYERAFTPVRLDFAGIVGDDLWEKHWSNRDTVIQAMKDSLDTSETISKKIREYYDGMVSTAVKSRLIPFLAKGTLEDDELDLLQDTAYCRQTFGISYPLLLPINESDDPSTRAKDSNGHNRYYIKPIEVNGRTYLVTSQWYARHRVPLENWLTSHVKA